MKKHIITLAAIAATATATQAQVTVATNTAASYTVSNTDLLQTSVSSVTDDGFDFRQSGGQLGFLNNLENEGVTVGTASLTDGVWYDHDPVAGWTNSGLTAANTESRGSAVTTTGSVGVWNFDLTTNTNGYDITSIELFSNWGSGDGRNEIRTTISYSLVGNAGYTDLTNPGDLSNLFVYSPVPVIGSVDGTQGQMTIAGLTLTGVDAIRFTFPAQENGGVGYSEIDVFGTASPIPEPSTFALLAGLMAFGAIAMRRR